MSVIEELEAKTASRLPGTPCFVGRALSMLPRETDRKLMEEALARRSTITAPVLAEHFRDAYKMRVSDQSIRRHRNLVCSCQSSTS